MTSAEGHKNDFVVRPYQQIKQFLGFVFVFESPCLQNLRFNGPMVNSSPLSCSITAILTLIEPHKLGYKAEVSLSE